MVSSLDAKFLSFEKFWYFIENFEFNNPFIYCLYGQTYYLFSWRLESAKEIFKEIRFCQISPQYLSKHVIRDLVEGEGICKPEVKAALEYYRDYKITTSDGNPRKPKDVLYVFSCKSLVVERFDPIKSACVPCRELTQVEVDNVTEHRYAVVVGRNMYTITGNRVEMFDPLGLCWNPCGEGW